MNLRLHILCLLGLVTSSCTIFNPATSGTAAVRAGPPRISPTPVGSINGQVLEMKDVPLTYRNRIRDVENNSAQRKMHLVWAGVEEAIDNKVLAAAAKESGVSVKELLKKNVNSQVEEPSEDELRIIYGMNETNLSISYELAEPYIRDRLKAQRRLELKRVFLHSLRAGKRITNEVPITALPRIRLEVRDEPSLGPTNAPVTLIQYSDFQCPYCARSRELLDELRSLYPTKLRIVFRNFPLEQHPEAKRAAEAAQCAHDQGKFWAFHDLLFAHQSALKEPDLIKYAQRVQMNMSTFKKCFEGKEVTEFVDKVYRSGVAIGVKGTPAIYINGIKLVGLLPLPLITAIIDNEIEK